MKKKEFIQQHILNYPFNAAAKDSKTKEPKTALEFAEDSWNSLTEAGYDDDKALLKWNKPIHEYDGRWSARATVKSLWKDDGKHLNISIENWDILQVVFVANPIPLEAPVIRVEDCDRNKLTFRKNDTDILRIIEGYASAKEFKANDPTGYAEMHSVKGGS